jgi:hypothetical protein
VDMLMILIKRYIEKIKDLIGDDRNEKFRL